MTRLLGWAIVTALAVALPREAAAQDWRTLQSARQLHDSGAYDVRIKYAAGRLEVGPAEAPFLYDMRLHYDAEHVRPLHVLEADRVLTLGVDQPTSVVRAGRSADENRMHVALSAAVPVDLSLELGSVQAELDLGGLSITSLGMQAGANEMHVDFRTPNRVPMRSLEVGASAASVKIEHLGNANAGEMTVRAGVGSVELDFTGTWTRDLDASVELTFGSMHLIVPEDVGLRLEVGKLFARVKADGLREHDGALVSENWDSARYRLTVRARTVFGNIEVRHTAR